MTYVGMIAADSPEGARPARYPIVGRSEDTDVDAAIAARDFRMVVLWGSPGSGRHTIAEQAALRYPGPVLRLRYPPVPPDPEGRLRWLTEADRVFARHRGGLVLALDRPDPDPIGSAALRQAALRWDLVVLALSGPAETVPEAVSSPWTTLACRVPVGPLRRDDVARFLAAALPGDVRPLLVATLHEATGGRPALLTDALDHGLRTGAIVQRHGVWLAPTGVELGARGAASVALDTATLSPAARDALRAVAIAGRLRGCELDRLTTSEAIAELERREFVTVGAADGHPADDTAAAERRPAGDHYRTALPAIGDAALAGADRAALARRVLTALPTPTDDESLVRRALLVAEAGDGQEHTDAEGRFLLHGAEAALRRFDVPATTRLSTAAVTAGAGWQARLLRAHALSWTGRCAACDAAVAAIDAPDAAALSQISATRAANLFWGLARPADATAVLAAAPRSEMVDALTEVTAFYLGDAAAVDLAPTPLADAHAEVWRTSVAAWARALRGLPVAPAEARTAEAAARGPGSTQPVTVWFGRAVQAAATGEPLVVPTSGFGHGDTGVLDIAATQLAVARGELDVANARGRRALAVAESLMPPSFVVFAGALLAQALGQLGDAAGAAAIAAQAEAAYGDQVAILRPELTLGHAWAAAAAGEHAGAAGLALTAADEARHRGAPVTEGFALLTALRLGAPRPQRAREVADAAPRAALLAAADAAEARVAAHAGARCGRVRPARRGRAGRRRRGRRRDGRGALHRRRPGEPGRRGPLPRRVPRRRRPHPGDRDARPVGDADAPRTPGRRRPRRRRPEPRDRLGTRHLDAHRRVLRRSAAHPDRDRDPRGDRVGAALDRRPRAGGTGARSGRMMHIQGNGRRSGGREICRDRRLAARRTSRATTEDQGRRRRAGTAHRRRRARRLG